MKKIDKYWKHISLVMIIKVILLTGVWFVFFSDAPKITDSVAGSHIFG